MSTTNRDSTRPAPLNQRIREAEQRLAGRQRSIGFRAAALGRNLREKLSSPITLLVAVGAGFAIGQFSKRKRAEPRADSDPPSTRPSIFATLMDAFTLATTVMAMLPAIRRQPVRDTEATGETP
jgi:hypothetical protein